MLDVINGNIMRLFLLFSHRKKQNQTGNRPKSEKSAKMSKSVSAKIHHFRPCQPKSQQRIERARPICASRLLAVAAIPTALAGIAAVTLGVGRFGVIVEQQLQ
jgi:hypothetical protein